MGIHIKITLNQKTNIKKPDKDLISPWLLWYVFGEMKNMFFSFLTKEMWATLALLMSRTYALPACWVIHTGWPLRLLLDQEMLSALDCAKWRHSNKTVNFFVFICKQNLSPTPFLAQCQMGCFFKYDSDFLHCRLFTPLGFFIWNYPGEPLCLKYKMIWKVKFKKKKKRQT